ESMNVGAERHGKWMDKVKKVMLPRHNYDVVTTLNYVVVQLKSNVILEETMAWLPRKDYAVVIKTRGVMFQRHRIR
ncbi:hypothetical protein Tco_1411759, partial [Tanacetum coccineum]